MKLKDVLKPLGISVTRHIPKAAGNVDVRITMPGAQDTADIANSTKCEGEDGKDSLHLEIPAGSLPVLVPKPLKDEPWWERWWKEIS